MEKRDYIARAFRPMNLTEAHIDYLTNCFSEFSFEKNELITRTDSIERHFYIVLEGVQLLYINSIRGNEKAIAFSYTGSFSGIYDSFLKEKPSQLELRALTKSRMIGITKNQYDELFEKFPEFNYWGRIAHQELLIGRLQRELELTNKDSKQRFDVFMERCPDDLLQIPQKYLASYLNMTPETFSRMRAQNS